MLTNIVITIFIIWVLFLAFVWWRAGLGKGRKFGNALAKHLGMNTGFFHTVVENGVTGPSLQVLSILERSGCTLQQACVELAPSLERGLIALEHKFGRQEQIDSAKPIVADLVNQWVNRQDL